MVAFRHVSGALSWAGVLLCICKAVLDTHKCTGIRKRRNHFDYSGRVDLPHNGIVEVNSAKHESVG